MILNGLACLGLAYSGCNVIAAVLFFTLSLSLHGAVSTGPLASLVDIAPNYAGITLGFGCTFSIMTGFISPIIVGYITYENQSVTAWQHIFEICAAMLFVCGGFFIWLNDSSLQPWNSPPKPVDEPKELKPLFNEKSVLNGDHDNTNGEEKQHM